MHRLLIVDDEIIIADGLYEIFVNIPNLDLDVYRVYSAEEALILLDRTRIDIVLSDIHMPGMNGLQLLSDIRDRWPDCRVIFLSGHTEFDYVYTAIKYDKVSYILKTEGYDKIIRQVEETIEDIEAGMKWNAVIKKAEEQMEAARELLKDNFLGNIIKGRIYQQEISPKQFSELGLTLDADKQVIMLIGRIDDLPKDMPYAIKTRRLYSVKLIAEQIFSQLNTVCITDDNSNLIWFIQPGENVAASWDKCLTFVRGSIELFQKGCRESLCVSISFAIDDSPASWLQLVERYSALKMLLNYRFGLDSEMLITGKSVVEQKLSKSHEQNKRVIDSMMLRQLEEALECGRKEDFFDCFNEFAAGLKDNASFHDIVALERYYSIALILLSYVNKWNLLDKVAFKTGIYKLMKIDEHDNWNDAMEYLGNVGEIVFDVQENERRRRTQDIIGFIQKYIGENIHLLDKISLICLADLVHFNPSYLSRIFKQEVGMNLSEYISEIRIKKAKQLLENPDIRINTVAEMLGYGVSTNFTRFFKKMTSITPQNYRDLL